MNSIRKKISAGIIIVACICNLILSLAFFYEAKSSLTKQVSGDLKSLSTFLKQNIEGKGIGNTQDIQSFIDVESSMGTQLSYISIIDKNYTCIASSQKSKVGTTIREKSIENVLNKGTTENSIRDIGDNKQAIDVSIPLSDGTDRIGVLSVGVPLDLLNSAVNKILLMTAIISIATLLMSILVGLMISKNITNPIKSLMKDMDKVSNGDFTVNFAVKSKDETKKLADSMNKAIGILCGMIIGIKNTAENLNAVSQNLSASSEEVTASSEDVAKAVGEVANGTQNQTSGLSNASKLLDGLAKNIDEASEKIKGLAMSGSNIENTANEGEIKLEELLKSIEDIRSSFEIVINKVNTLDDSVGKINEITDVINSVAEQTNLLALNAAIEAARAGEVGRGFAVVADEIRKLAEQVLESSKGISSLVEQVTSETKDVHITTNTVSDKVGVQIETVNNTVLSFKNILGIVSEIGPDIDEVEKKLIDTVKSKDDVVSNIDQVASASEEVSASAEEISSAAQQQTKATEELTSSALKLSSMANELAGNIEKFKTE